MTQVDIRALARLARVEISDQEVAKLEAEIPALLSFVEQIQKVDISSDAPAPALRNVMRDDAKAIEGGAYTEKILSQAPERSGDRIAVKQVISRKK